MDRLIRDHIESGYILRAEYRPIKEPDQEIDYIIRYYPGSGAKESNSRIQTFIREKRNRSKPGGALHSPAMITTGTPISNLVPSVVTAAHHDLAAELILNFRISPLKACALALTRKEGVSAQLAAWPFRETTPRNPAGWMIQAIENDYDLPVAYLDHRSKQHAAAARIAADAQIQSCALCDDKGFRKVRSSEYPTGAMRQCTHNPDIEGKYQAFEISTPDIAASPDAQNATESGENPRDEKSPTKLSAS